MVLVETGQGTALSRPVEEARYSTQIMVSGQLSVIPGNIVLAKMVEARTRRDIDADSRSAAAAPDA